MESINQSQLKRESRLLNKKYEQFGRVNKQFQQWLSKRGYTLVELGTGPRSFTLSGDVGTKFFANDKAPYFGIGVYNIGRKSGRISVSVYRAWVKKVG